MRTRSAELFEITIIYRKYTVQSLVYIILFIKNFKTDKVCRISRENIYVENMTDFL